MVEDGHVWKNMCSTLRLTGAVYRLPQSGKRLYIEAGRPHRRVQKSTDHRTSPPTSGGARARAKGGPGKQGLPGWGDCRRVRAGASQCPWDHFGEKAEPDPLAVIALAASSPAARFARCSGFLRQEYRPSFLESFGPAAGLAAFLSLGATMSLSSLAQEFPGWSATATRTHESR